MCLPASPVPTSKARARTIAPASGQCQERQHRAGRPILNRADDSRSHRNQGDSIRLPRQAAAAAVRYRLRAPCPRRNFARPRSARNRRHTSLLRRLSRPSPLGRRTHLPLLRKRSPLPVLRSLPPLRRKHRRPRLPWNRVRSTPIRRRRRATLAVGRGRPKSDAGLGNSGRSHRLGRRRHPQRRSHRRRCLIQASRQSRFHHLRTVSPIVRRLGKLGNRSQHRVPRQCNNLARQFQCRCPLRALRVSLLDRTTVCRILHRPNEQRNRSCPPSRRNRKPVLPSANRRLLRLPRHSRVDKGTMPVLQQILRPRRERHSRRRSSEWVRRAHWPKLQMLQIWRADRSRRPLPSSARRWSFQNRDT